MSKDAYGIGFEFSKNRHLKNENREFYSSIKAQLLICSMLMCLMFAAITPSRADEVIKPQTQNEPANQRHVPPVKIRSGSGCACGHQQARRLGGYRELVGVSQ